MKVILDRDVLSFGLSVVSRSAAVRTSLPILSHALLTANGDGLTIAASNLEHMAICTLPAEVQDPGSTTVPMKTLVDLVNALDGPVVLSSNDREVLSIRCGRSRSSIKGIAADEFVDVPEIFEPQVLLDPNEFQVMVQQVAICAARDESRPVLTGVSIQLDDSGLTMCSADGFRLAVRKSGASCDDPISIIVPAKALTEFRRIMGVVTRADSTAGSVGLTLGTGRCVLSYGGAVLIAQLIEGKFPDYTQIIPTSYTATVQADTGELLSAARIAGIFAREADNTVTLDVGADSIAVSGRGELGDNQVQLSASSSGDFQDLIIAFNGQYMIDMLRQLGTDDVALLMNTPMSPGVLRPVDGDDLTYVIMPIQLDS